MGHSNHPDGGKPARVNQWNVSLQREVLSRVTVEVSYVGNRGHGLEANNLIAYNATPLERFTERGLDLNNAADRQLLTSRIDSPLAASRGFGKPYASFPGSATVAQSLRPFPQFNDGLAVRWAPLGQTWYDALHVNRRSASGITSGMRPHLRIRRNARSAAEAIRAPVGERRTTCLDREAQKAGGEFAAAHLRPELQLSDAAQRWRRGCLLGDWTFAVLLRYGAGR